MFYFFLNPEIKVLVTKYLIKNKIGTYKNRKWDLDGCTKEVLAKLQAEESRANQSKLVC